VDGPRLHYVASGTIGTLEAPRHDLPARLKIIVEGIQEVQQRWQAQASAVEIVFVNVNPQSTLLLGQARGAALAALVMSGLPVAEYSPAQLKKAVVGHGNATKGDMQEMVRRLLNLPAQPGKDAADALGLAITHAHVARHLDALGLATTLDPKVHGRYRSARAR